MKILRQKQTRKNTVIVTIEIGLNDSILAVDPSMHYKLGYPIEDIVTGHEIIESVPATWCSVEQRWISD